jgi:DNA-binding MurR/RpiR family transcriptional regulator
MKEGEILLAIVNDGPSVDSGYAVRMAKEKGLKTICITGTGVVLPAREAETTVIVPVKTPAGVPSFGTEMQILSLIWEALATRRKEETAKHYKTQQEKHGQTPQITRRDARIRGRLPARDVEQERRGVIPSLSHTKRLPKRSRFY